MLSNMGGRVAANRLGQQQKINEFNTMLDDDYLPRNCEYLV